MRKSKDKKVQQFLNELKSFDGKKFKIVEAAREIVFNIYPKVTERIIYGGIMFTLEDDVGGLWVSKHHVSFEFSNGYKLRDPKKTLKGEGKYRRHLKLTKREDIDDKKVAFFVKQLA